MLWRSSAWPTPSETILLPLRWRTRFCFGRTSGALCKNLFLRNKKGNHHYLVIAEHRRPVDLKALAKLLRDDRLSFASDERLHRHLGVTPGAVSPFGLIHDEARAVMVIVDEGLREAEYLSFHPNVNTSTLTISGAAFRTFLAWRGNSIRYVRFSF